jgi:hypothetical protein
MDELGNDHRSHRLSHIWVNEEGKLCEMYRMGDAVVNRLFNCVRWNFDGLIKFSFNPVFITEVGW